MDEFLCSLCGGWDDDLQNGICEFCTSDGKDDRMSEHECVTWEFVDCDEHHEHDDDCRNLRVCVECGA